MIPTSYYLDPTKGKERNDWQVGYGVGHLALGLDIWDTVEVLLLDFEFGDANIPNKKNDHIHNGPTFGQVGDWHCFCDGWWDDLG